jgi:hypothetical protein
MTTATVGRIVHLLVHPDDNAGSDHAPAIITSVVDDEPTARVGFVHGNPDGRRDTEAHQLVNLTAFTAQGPVQATDVPLYADRDAAHADLAEHRKALTATTHPDGREGRWADHDVHRWVPAAYWPDVEAKKPAKAVASSGGKASGE